MINSTAVNDSAVPLSEIRSAVSPQFVSSFDEAGLPAELLREFVYALDHFNEMMIQPGFPVDRLLTTPDIVNYGEEATGAFNMAHRLLGSTTPLGVAVSQTITDLIQEFMDQHYAKTINTVLTALRIPGVTLSLDNEPRFVGITYTTDHPHFCIVSYRDLGKNVGLNLPLLSQRLK